MSKTKLNPHTILINQVLEIASYHQDTVFLWKNNTGATAVETEAGRRFFRFGLAGSADIIGLNACGKFLAFECKTGKAKLRPSQLDFQAQILKLGGEYVIIRHLSDFTDWLNLHR